MWWAIGGGGLIVFTDSQNRPSPTRGRAQVEFGRSARRAKGGLMVRVQPEMAKLLDDWRRKQEDLPGRPEAIRRLVELGLKAKR